ncbi:von Willebrand factor D and EGF domain-containing protein-like [Saccoglossus kowalevskii]
MEFKDEKWKEFGESFKTPGEFAGIHTMFCYLPVSRIRRQVVSPTDEGISIHAMRISISNDGIVESNANIFVTYDSLCLNCSTSGDCQQKDNTCLISGKCYSAGEKSAFDECLECQPINSGEDWTNALDRSCDTSTGVTSTTDMVTLHQVRYNTNKMWLLFLGLGLGLFIAIVVTLIVGVMIKK